MISVTNLRKSYGDLVAVDDLSFQCQPGELFALLGANGAGKTTTIRCMISALGFDSGSIVVDGLQVGPDSATVRERIGVVFQQSLLDDLLTVEENLLIKAKLYGLDRDRCLDVMDLVDATRFKKQRYGQLSGGQRRRVDIARALLPQPSVIFLDEPTAGLDPQSREQVWDAVHQLRTRRHMTVVLTTHYMEETEAADHVVILDRGRKVAEGTPAHLRAEFSSPLLSLVVHPKAVDPVKKLLSGTELVRSWRIEGGAFKVAVTNSVAARRILTACDKVLLDFEFRRGSMDDVFLNFIRPSSETDPGESGGREQGILAGTEARS